MKAKKENFWTDLETKQITKEQIESCLFSKFGVPTNPTQTNLCQEIIKKINSYYFIEEPENQTIFSLIGTVLKITEKKRKKGKHRGETKYLLELSEPKGEVFQIYQENLEPAKWTQIQNLAVLGKKLIFKYKKFITNKELLDFDKARAK
ncbi:MAG: hypothetical protein GBAus27B_000442 [Mycoplasmataceae bacterium]|nr:MAG: hypothetical protein GBAus27B_000442 [Mycoplasmataceae bacterium]